MLMAEFGVTILENNRSVRPAAVDIFIRTTGADPNWARKGGRMRILGNWRTDGASLISHTGDGSFYFDGMGGAMLCGRPLHDATTGEYSAEEILYMSGLREIYRFFEREGGQGTQFAQPCRLGDCIHPGGILWKCFSAKRLV
jgi:hypothetical protein